MGKRSKVFIVLALMSVLFTGCQNRTKSVQNICSNFNTFHSTTNTVLDGEYYSSDALLLMRTMKNNCSLEVITAGEIECKVSIEYPDLTTLVENVNNDSGFVRDYFRLQDTQSDETVINDLLYSYLFVSIQSASKKTEEIYISVDDTSVITDDSIIELFMSDAQKAIGVIRECIKKPDFYDNQYSMLEKRNYDVGEVFLITVDNNIYLVEFKNVCVGQQAIEKITSLSPNNHVPSYDGYSLMWYEYELTNLGEDSIYKDIFVSANCDRVLNYEDANLFGLINESKINAGQTVIITNVGICKDNYCLIWQDFTNGILYQIKQK